MLNYSINLRTVKDFRNFINMLVRFSVSGYVTDGRQFKKRICSIMEIIKYCPLENLNLVITRCREDDIESLDEYIMASGLGTRKAEMAASA